MMRTTMLAAALLTAWSPGWAARRPVCHADRAQPMLGRPALPEFAARALRLSRARELRWIAPGTMQTMEFQPDRLNLEIDSQRNIVKISCG